MNDETSYSVPEYDSNPFIAKLPLLKTRKTIFAALQSKPEYSEEECGYPPHYRKHFVLRLTRFFEPVSRHIELAERLDYILRQGYIGRNPLTHDYVRHLQNDFKRTIQKNVYAENLMPVENTATSFSIVGCSGVGKSKAIEKILHQYPQTITHSEPFSLIQVPWLKLDCPHQGSPRQLCKNFFVSIDNLLCTEYDRLYGGTRASLDEMMVHMAQVANLHALGLLVLDEIQHLRKSKKSVNSSGSDQLLNFLVTLVNTIGVPVILIGTLSAKAILQKDFRQARRAAGFGSAQWDRYAYDVEWKHIVQRLWKYQWTKDFTPLTPEIEATLYDESQGILDVLVKLVILSQLKVISINESRTQGEGLTSDLIRRVALEDFKLIKPMIDALRRNDYEAIFQYDDLFDFEEHISSRFSQIATTSTSTSSLSEFVDAPVPAVDKLSILMRIGVSEVEARGILSNLTTSAPPITAKHMIGENPCQDQPKVQHEEIQASGDLRKAKGLVSGTLPTVYHVLKELGVISCPLTDFEVGN